MTVKKRETADSVSLVNDQGMDDHLSSLRYAGMIQKALMPDPDVLKGYLKDFFILFLPRDIVSGDFYYAFCNRHKMVVAVGDCTGHGVPGALLSILGINMLNEIMQSGNNLKANRLLNLMREKVMKALHQTGSGAEAKDSIDIGLCLIECASGKLEYAGANRPLIMVRNGEMTEYKPDRVTIGIAPLKETSFVNNYINTIPGDTFYLFSDGFSDQFGEKSDKKFKHNNFRRLIESVQGLSLSKQKEQFENAFKEWKGNARQIDDVLVFGFQI
jgi:serine phosphatase RsbU (regulator of sigma subunit)